MKPGRAWVRLQSGKRLDLLNPQPDSWADRDLAIGLAWTYRWGGQSRWDQPLSVAQHSLLVLTLRQQMQPHQPLTRGEALRELLHDGHEGFLGFDPISPVKPHLGQDFHDVANRLQQAIDARYDLPPWCGDDHVLHKRADRLAAASEAVHVAGWHPTELGETLNITLTPLSDDPLSRPSGLTPWQPWPTKLVASVFLYKLRELTNSEWTPDQPASLDAALARCRELEALADAFAQLPEKQQRKYVAPKGSPFRRHLGFGDSRQRPGDGRGYRGRRRAGRGWRVAPRPTVHDLHVGRAADPLQGIQLPCRRRVISSGGRTKLSVRSTFPPCVVRSLPG